MYRRDDGYVWSGEKRNRTDPVYEKKYLIKYLEAQVFIEQ